VKVVIAIILDEQKKILITQRPHHVPHGGFWEFPGGKVECNESVEAALIREIKEEVGIDVVQYQHVADIKHQYPNKMVQLIVFMVTQFVGLPICMEGQLNMKWVINSDLDPNDFPEANRKIIALL
jgi:8-oxo-dGTP diphosphatase